MRGGSCTPAHRGGCIFLFVCRNGILWEAQIITPHHPWDPLVKTPFFFWISCLGLTLFLIAAPARALDDAHWVKADQAIQRGIAYLRSVQADDGSWTPMPGPAVTAMALMAMLDQPDMDPTDPAVAKALDYILAMQHDDGGIYDAILPNYNTAICLSALSRVADRPGMEQIIDKAQQFLVGLQWNGQPDPHGQDVNEAHPYFGGAGYGRHGRPDMSNTAIMIQGLHDSGLDCNQPVYQRALVFIQRCQGLDTNPAITPDGGFIYATSINQNLIGVGESKASPKRMDQAKQGIPVSGLRTYGSMTYAGFKSYLYANLAHDDPRVTQAYQWIQNHYALDRNPGMPDDMAQQGHFYYFMTFAKALQAWGSTNIDTPHAGSRDWANDLVDQVTAMQHEDGSWSNPSPRWMEDDPALATCFALIALNAACDR